MPILVGISIIAFSLIHLVPGDPIEVMLGDHYTPERGRVLSAFFGLDKPLPVQYLTFVWNVLHLNFGNSIAQGDAPVAGLIESRIWNTVFLATYALSLALVISVPLAIISAVKANQLPDYLIRAPMMVALAMPGFWLGLIFILVFSVQVHIFPTSGVGDPVLPLIWSLTLPAFTLGLSLAPLLTRTLRGSVVESLGSDSVVAARARGLSESRVIFRHVMRPCLVALVTLVGYLAGALLSGSVVIETVFAIPGIGSLLVQSVSQRDFPVIQALALLFGVVTVVCVLITDLVNAALDPRIRL
jgi:peptide/nickel transport system permease protein